jgi:hypothetical protein
LTCFMRWTPATSKQFLISAYFVAFSPQANYTDRAIAACRRN